MDLIRISDDGAMSKEDPRCLQSSRNYIAQGASAGYAPRYWAQTTAYFPHRVLYLVSQRRMRLTAMS